MLEMPQGDNLPEIFDESLQAIREEWQDLPTMLYMMVHDKYRGMLDALTVTGSLTKPIT